MTRPWAPNGPKRRDPGHEEADQQHVHRQPRGAGHQRRAHHRGDPVAGRGQRPRGHDARDGAGQAREQRDERPSLQARLGHHPVHQERRPRHVPDALQQRDHQEQQGDLRQEHEHPADPADERPGDEVREPRDRDAVRGDRAERAEPVLDDGLDRRRDGEDDLEEHEHRREEDRGAPDGMQQHGVDAARAAVGGRHAGSPRSTSTESIQRRSSAGAVGGRISGEDQAAGAASRSRSSRRSRLLPATAVTTGRPSARRRAGRSTEPCRFVSSSVKVRTTHTGSPVCSTCASRPSDRRRVVASRVTTTPSGARSTPRVDSDAVGSSVSTTIRSSRLIGSRL